jgi:hypothetical protein
MPFNDKARLIPNGRELVCGQAEIDIDDAMALRAGEQGFSQRVKRAHVE